MNFNHRHIFTSLAWVRRWGDREKHRRIKNTNGEWWRKWESEAFI